MKAGLIIGGMAALLGLSAAGENLTRFGCWFDQDYSGLDAATWTDTLGRWRCAAMADNAFVPGESPHVALNSGMEPLVFAPTNVTSLTANRAMAIESKMTFPGESDEEMLPSDAKAGFTVLGDEHGSFFAGYAADGWHALQTPGVDPEPNREYLVRIELDYRTGKPASADPYKMIAYVSYSVDGVRLSDKAGESWFVAPDAANKGVVSEVGFSGVGGKVGEIRGEEQVAARAKVDFPLQRAGKDAVFSFNVTTNAGATLSGDLAFRWFVGDWKGSYADTPVSSAATYRPTGADYARWIKAEVYDDNGYAGEGRFWYSKLPVFYITTDDGKMPGNDKKGHAGRLAIQGNAQFGNDYDGKLEEVKVRGNSTANRDKKPYKLKLDKKANLFGLSGGTGGKNKHWVLLANFYDESNLRNATAFGIADALGMENVIHSTWVDVVFNGEYLGLYQLTEHIRIGEDRVNVYDWEDAGETLAEKIHDSDATLTDADEDAMADALSTDFSWVTSGTYTYTNGVTYSAKKVWKKYTDDITGGYLIEFSHEFDELSQFVVTNRTGILGVPTMINKPEYLYTNPTMMDWIRGYLQDYFDAITAPDGYDTKGRHYSELADVRQMAAFLMTMEVMGNNDGSYKSRWAYKGQGEKLKFGPAWDFDWGCASPVLGSWTSTVDAFGRTVWNIPYGLITGWRVAQYASSVEETSAKYGKYLDAPGFWKEWTDDPYMAQQLVEVYRQARPYLAELVRDGGKLDDDIAYLRESALANEAKWIFKIGFSGGATDSVDPGDAAWFKYYLSNRLAWLDSIIDQGASALMASLKTSKSAAPYTRSDDVKATYPVSVPAAEPGDAQVDCVTVALAGAVSAAVTAKSDCKSVRFYVNGLHVGDADVKDGAADVLLPAACLAESVANVVAVDAVDADGKIVSRNWSLVSGTAATPMPSGDVPPGGEAVSIPYEWINANYPALTNNGWGAALPAEYAALVNKLDENGLSPLGKRVPFSYDYVAGTDPADTNQLLTVSIDMSEMVNGMPKITVDPDLGDRRVYTVLGVSNLLDSAWAPAVEGHRFFKVEVRLP